MESFDFSLGLWVSWPAVFLLDPVVADEFFEGVTAAFCPGVAGGKHQPVVGEGGLWWAEVADEV